MKVVFTEDCAADGCKNKSLGPPKKMCETHEKKYEKGEPFKAFYGKTVQKKEFQNPKTQK